MKKLGLLAGVLTLASLVIPVAASPASATPVPLPGTYAEQLGGTWYCFGQKVTISKPDYSNSDFAAFYGTSGTDVILGTEGRDIIQASPGDVVCGRGGNDQIRIWDSADASVRTKIDAGVGDDLILSDQAAWDEVDASPPDWEPSVGLTTGNILEIHAGPGSDTIDHAYGSNGSNDNGRQGNDQIFTDGGADTVDCGAGKYDVLHRIPGESVAKTGCEKAVDATAYATFAKFKANTGSWSMVCPGQPSKTATWYVSSTSYGATNPCQHELDFAFGPIGGPEWSVIHVVPATKFVLKGQLAKDGFYRMIAFQDFDCSSDPNAIDYVTHANGTVTVFDCSNY
jgi:Ca2+-binding RTX toxin-like protein